LKIASDRFFNGQSYIDRTAWGSNKGQLNQNQLDGGVRFLGGLARFEGKTIDTYLRVAGDANEVIIDKSQGDSGCIVCMKDG